MEQCDVDAELERVTAETDLDVEREASGECGYRGPTRAGRKAAQSYVRPTPR